MCRYNTVMKLVFLGTSCAIVYYIRYHRIIRLTYDKDQDTFRHWMLIAPSALLALITAHPRSFLEVCSRLRSQQPSMLHRVEQNNYSSSSSSTHGLLMEMPKSRCSGQESAACLLGTLRDSSWTRCECPVV